MHSALGPGHMVAGRYRLLDQVGRGAMGIVWRGRDDLLDRDVAIKQIVLAPMSSDTDAEASYQRTLREARTAARLSHAGVVTVFDVVEEDGSPWIVMELVRARPLDQVVAEDGPLPPAQAAQLGLSLLDALTTAHAAGVLHRDVKPSNVLIRPDGKAVLTDFGIATIQGDPGLTQAGMVVGTPGFAPPERVRGATATTASDLWSLGATLYAAVEGRGPFDRAGGSAAIVASIATEPAPRAPSAGPLAPVIDALLRADPAMRPDAAATATMLADAWAAARRSDLAAGLMGSSHPAGEPPAAAGPAGQAGLHATTATQVVSVPQVAVIAGIPPGGQADATSTAGSEQPASLASPAPGASAGASADPAPASVTQAGAGAAGAAGVAGVAAAVSVVPDLMATPVFAELKMPAPEASGTQLRTADHLGPAGPLDQAGAAGSPDAPIVQPGSGRRSKLADLVHSRRGIWLLTPVAVAAVVAGLILAFPNIGSSFVQGLSQLNPAGTSSNPAAAAKADGATLGGSRSAGRHAGRTGSSGRQAHGKTAPSGKPTGKRAPSGKPSPSGSPSGSPSPTPTPSPSTTGPSSGGTPQPPNGFGYQSVSATTAGTTAGFKVAVPTAWLMIPGLTTTFEPVAGAARLVVSMGPFVAPGPLREARHLQAAAIAHHRFHLYHLVSIFAVSYHGRPAATWTFWYRPRTSIHDINVTELIYIAKTPAGPQPYILAVSAPAPRTAWAGHVFSVAVRTFRALP